MPPARLLMTAVVTASSMSFLPEAPPLLINPMPAHVAARHLVSAQVNRMVGGQVRVDAVVNLSVARSLQPCNRRCSPAASA